MNWKIVFACAAVAAAPVSHALAATNVALSSDGASVSAASSVIDYAGYGLTTINGGVPTAEDNLLTTSPTAWLSDNDTRYLFSDYDTNSNVVIDLGSTRTLLSAGATWYTAQYQDRPPTIFSVAISTNGVSWTDEGSISTLPSGGGADLVTFAAPADALYVRYSFGGLGGGPDAGIGVSELFAGANVPEPAAWALMQMGVAGLGAALRRTRGVARVRA
jgi:hypothetical protein